jgi:hypothetical protein
MTDAERAIHEGVLALEKRRSVKRANDALDAVVDYAGQIRRRVERGEYVSAAGDLRNVGGHLADLGEAIGRLQVLALLDELDAKRAERGRAHGRAVEVLDGIDDSTPDGFRELVRFGLKHSSVPAFAAALGVTQNSIRRWSDGCGLVVAAEVRAGVREYVRKRLDGR